MQKELFDSTNSSFANNFINNTILHIFFVITIHQNGSLITPLGVVTPFLESFSLIEYGY